MARKPRSLCRFTCCRCGDRELVTGGNTPFVCSACRAASGKSHTPQYLAHRAVAQAIRAGELKRPAEFLCADCGVRASEYDHRDYSKPLEVAPVCRRCNHARGPAVGSPAARTRSIPSLPP